MNIRMVGLIEMRRSGYQPDCCFRYQNERTHFDIAVHARDRLDFSRDIRMFFIILVISVFEWPCCRWYIFIIVLV